MLDSKELSHLRQKIAAEYLTYAGHAAMGGLKVHKAERMEWLKALSDKLDIMFERSVDPHIEYIEAVCAVDREIAIAEDAFKAGYNAAAQRAVDFAPTVIRDWEAHREAAWSDYEPAEDLTGGGTDGNA